MGTKSTIAVIVLVAAILLFVGMQGRSGDSPDDQIDNQNDEQNLSLNNTNIERSNMSELSITGSASTSGGAADKNPIVTLNTNQGVIKLELFLIESPITAGNFVKLAEEGFYNQTKFHRVIEGFMIQGGDPLSKDDSKAAMWGTGGPGYAIQDEFVEGLSNARGTLSMANSGPNSGGSQFFINLVDNGFLDWNDSRSPGKHPVFGKVIEGMDVVDAIGATNTGPGDRPASPIIIESVTVSR